MGERPTEYPTNPADWWTEPESITRREYNEKLLAQQARIAELEGALEPFANVALNDIDPGTSDEAVGFWRPWGLRKVPLKAKHFRNAAKVRGKQ